MTVPETLIGSTPFFQSNAKRTPYHIAIIMDGNRRWAKERGLPAIAGHWKGAETLTEVVRGASQLGIKVLTVFCFSTENWDRPLEEVEELMCLFEVYLRNQRCMMLEEGVRLSAIGNLSRLPEAVQKELQYSLEVTAHCEKIDLVLAINYGGRDDIRRAFIGMLEDWNTGILAKEEISEYTISRYLDTARWPDPDVFIRSSGEKRQSNFLLWQLSYTEFYYTDVLWPDFNMAELKKAVFEFQQRARRLGG